MYIYIWLAQPRNLCRHMTVPCDNGETPIVPRITFHMSAFVNQDKRVCSSYNGMFSTHGGFCARP